MIIRTFVAALALALSPALASAMCSDRHKSTVSHCGLGQVYDAATETCITPVTG